MSENLTITTERVDDIPLLMAQLDRLDVAPLLDQFFPTHGRWQGLSLGRVTQVWLTFILSEANHRLSHVQPWAAQRRHTLEACLGQPVRALDVSDDRLAAVLDQLSDDARWSACECALNQRTVRVYNLQPERVRIDSTTAKSYATVDADGLLQLGHSKDHRPDLPQVKINVSVLDPLGLPLTTTVVAGDRADDRLYVPEIQRVQQSLGQRGVTYIGDCKMAAQETRAYVAARGDYYLCPLSSVQVPAEALTALVTPVWQGQQAVTPIVRPGASDEDAPELLAEGYDYTLSLTATVEGRPVQWEERRLVIRSLHLAQQQEETLRRRVTHAQAALAALNERRQGKRRWPDAETVRPVAEAIVRQYQVEGVLTVHYQTQTRERPVRRYGTRPAAMRVEQACQVSAQVEELALAAAVQRLGWRVYATNQEAASLSLEQAVLAYRTEYRIERGFGRLKGKPLALTPLYLDSEARITGLIRLLMIGLRVLTSLEFGVRRQLQTTGGRIPGLYPGNPTRATARPTAELMLRAFTGLTLTQIRDGPLVRVHLTPISKVHRQILHLVGLSPMIYERVVQHSSKPWFHLSEP